MNASDSVNPGEIFLCNPYPVDAPKVTARETRSGAHTVYELIFLQKHALLIPIPWASHNEQQKNADVYAETGLGLVLSEDSLSSEIFIANLEKLVQENIFKSDSKLKVSENSAAEMGYDILQLLKKA